MSETLDQKAQVERVKLYQVSPELYEAMQVLSNAAAKDIDPELAQLSKIRASQMNHCVFCLDMYCHDARNRGISAQKLALVAAWEEADEVFTERERAALELTEEVTELTGRGHVSDQVYSPAAAVFSERELGSRNRDGTEHQRLEPHRRRHSSSAALPLTAPFIERSNPMHTAYIIVTLLAAAFVGFSAWALSVHAGFIMEPLERLEVPRSWWPWLAAAKAAGAVGLVIGLFVPVIGALAAICLVLYFAGAVITTLRVRWYGHIPVPLMYVAPVVAALALGFAAGWPHWTVGS